MLYHPLQYYRDFCAHVLVCILCSFLSKSIIRPSCAFSPAPSALSLSSRVVRAPGYRPRGGLSTRIRNTKSLVRDIRRALFVVVLFTSQIYSTASHESAGWGLTQYAAAPQPHPPGPEGERGERGVREAAGTGGERGRLRRRGLLVQAAELIVPGKTGEFDSSISLDFPRLHTVKVALAQRFS